MLTDFANRGRLTLILFSHRGEGCSVVATNNVLVVG